MGLVLRCLSILGGSPDVKQLDDCECERISLFVLGLNATNVCLFADNEDRYSFGRLFTKNTLDMISKMEFAWNWDNIQWLKTLEILSNFCSLFMEREVPILFSIFRPFWRFSSLTESTLLQGTKHSRRCFILLHSNYALFWNFGCLFRSFFFVAKNRWNPFKITSKFALVYAK